jgi:hypothetical protein
MSHPYFQGTEPPANPDRFNEHVNNIIFQAMTIPTFRLVVFAAPTGNVVVTKLLSLNDPRIWIIGTDTEDHETDTANLSTMTIGGPQWRAHFFHSIVSDFLAETVDRESEFAVEKVLRTFLTNGNLTSSEVEK